MKKKLEPLQLKQKDLHFHNAMNTPNKIFLVPLYCRFNSYYSAEFINRNPRNLEKIRIARKPDGYHLDKPGRKFWHKLVLIPSKRTVTAQVVHYLNGPVIQAKTSEWALRKQLYSINDTCAYINLGRVFAQRCLEFGISEMYCDIKPLQGGRVEKFLNEVANGGIKLEELEVYKKPNAWDWNRPEKPWEVTEE
ncbi:large ribosomal subunit protein uL18m [Plodia interpunctella]|uniref:large ribosomal subunit protein uL18m n=1 Tax=Plodia interpunctella TaxID=58824 RepID=UPI002368E68E|nr:39S ribosomal protein L18, mitochondrial [Plodia interpunctella]